MSIPKDIMSEYPVLGDLSILLGYRGSIAHGMYVPNTDPNSIDDKDAMGVCVMPLDYYLGMTHEMTKGTLEIKQDEWDIVVYELRKFVSLLIKGNLNVLSMLWLDENMYIKRTEAGRMLVENRGLFVGRHVYHSFVGYAYGQMKRMTHYKCEGYMGEKRKKLVEKYGMDCKNAAHLIRLLRMGIEFLKDGELYVTRQDAKQLLEIKRGEWELARVKEEADRLFKVAEQAFLASTLPLRPDADKVNRMLVQVMLSAMKEKGVKVDGFTLAGGT